MPSRSDSEVSKIIVALAPPEQVAHILAPVKNLASTINTIGRTSGVSVGQFCLVLCSVLLAYARHPNSEYENHIADLSALILAHEIKRTRKQKENKPNEPVQFDS